MGITTHSESVQPLQSVNLVYQSCSWSRAALDPYGIEMITNDYLFMLLIIYVYLIMCLWGCDKPLATQLLKIATY